MGSPALPTLTGDLVDFFEENDAKVVNTFEGVTCDIVENGIFNRIVGSLRSRD